MKNIRALSQVCLNQKSEVEKFFLEALEQIKEEIRKKIANEKRVLKHKYGSFNPNGAKRSSIGGGDLNSSIMGGNPENSKLAGETSKPYSEKVDLNDLDWEDRERVLRLLFSKINVGAPGNAAAAQAKDYDDQ